MAIRSYLITGARAPVALHLTRLLAKSGHRVHLADSLRHPLAAASRLHHGYHVIPSLRDNPAAAKNVLYNLIRRLQIDYVVPTCEEVVYLSQMWRDNVMPVPLFAPDFALLEQVHNKYRFIQLCRTLGLGAPETRLLQSPEDIAALVDQAGNLVFKPVWSRFATQTVIRPSKTDLAQVRPNTTVPWVAQDYVEGSEICVYAIAHAGIVKALSAYRGIVRAGLGASVCFAPVQDAAVNAFVTAFTHGTGWTGQIAFDLIRQHDGQVLPIECNPRATSGLHFFRDHQSFVRAIDGTGDAVPDVTTPQGVPLAIWLYGLPQILRPHGWRAFCHALTETGDIMDWPGDRIRLGKQIQPFAEIASMAWRHKISLQTAATRDIAWDGPDQSVV